jgi:hypothetical protein
MTKVAGTTLVCALGIGLSVASAQTNVINQNAIGYVRITVQPGLALVRYDFEPVDGNPLKTEDVFDALPLGTTVWSFENEQWVPNNKSGIPPNFSTWGSRDEQHTIQRGDVYLVDVPPGGGFHELYLMGEVPDDETFPVTATAIFSGYGYPYPRDIEWASTAIASVVPSTSKAWRYDRDLGWRFALKTAGSWSAWDLGGGADTTLPAGEGVILQISTGSRTTEEEQPYFLTAGASSTPKLGITEAIGAPAPALVVSWTPNDPGWKLQETVTLERPTWRDAPSGTANPTLIFVSGTRMTFRLLKPGE